MTATRKPPIFGAEPWATVADREWCHFDWWFALTTVTDFDGDADALRTALEDTLRSRYQRRGEMQAKLSHLADLRSRLDEAGLTFAGLADAEEPDQRIVAKARRKVLDQALEGRAMTGPMHNTPARQLHDRALRASWDQFPSDPRRLYEGLAGRSNNFVPKGRSFDAARRLRERLDNLDGPRRTLPDRLALYRAFHTIGIELAERADDSYGVIGELRRDAFETYVAIDWADTGMDKAAYWQDMCELMVAEVYALTYQDDALPFRHVPDDDAELVETILLRLAEEYRAAYEDYQADQALQLIAWLHIAGTRYDRYIADAERLGSEHWMPIVALAQSAISAEQPDLAVEVFRSADRPGMHRDTLRQRCRELTGVMLDDGIDHHLRIVE